LRHTEAFSFYQRIEAYGIEVCSCPGTTILITPVQLHMHFDVLSSIGCPPSITVGAPGIQGADVAGMHGIGVSTPNAAAVAAATVGFAGDMHMPNGAMFTTGTWSMIFAANWLLICVRLMGSTDNVEGAIPIVHASSAVMTVA
jgi:hypothetical protein